MSDNAADDIFCPGCGEAVPYPLPEYRHCLPWQCTQCGETYGIGAEGVTFKIRDSKCPVDPLLSPDIARAWCYYSGPNNWYVYALCYSAGIPFYVGKGRKLRALAHEAECRSVCPVDRYEKHDLIDDLHAAGEPIWYSFLALTPSEQAAIATENHYLRLWGRRSHGGMLVNLAGPTRLDLHYDSMMDCWPIDTSPLKDFPEAKGKWKKAIRPVQHPYVIVPPPMGSAVVSGAVSTCPACGERYQYMAAMRDSRCICSNCGHYVCPFTNETDDGSQRVFYGTVIE